MMCIRRSIDPLLETGRLPIDTHKGEEEEEEYEYIYN